jgi:hypothetical protein
MKQKLAASVIIAAIFILLCSFTSNKSIKLIPLPKPQGEFGPIGFKITADWMDGTIEFRFPETIDGEDGMYFIDHYRPDMVPISKVKNYPDWNINKETGEISYSYTTPEGIEFGGIATPGDEVIQMEFFIKNHTSKAIMDVTPQLCLALANSKDFNTTKVASDVFISVNKELISVDKLTPSAAEKKRDPLLVIAKDGFTNLEGVGKTKFEGPGHDIFMSNYVKEKDGSLKYIWWMPDQTSDEDIIFRESRDKKHLVAVSWPGSVSNLVYNSINPCIHAGPSIQYTINAGRERHWYGTIYLMKNDHNELLKRYKNGQRPN